MFQTVAIVVSLALTAVTVVMVAQAVRSMLGVLRMGQPATGRSEEPARRTATMLKETLLHTRMLQWTWVGVMHWFVFAAFLFLSTAVLAAYFQLFQPDFAWPVIGHWYPYEWFSEVIGLLSTIGIIWLIVYRQKHHPRSLGRNSRFFGSTFWQAYFVEFLALFEGSAILFVRGAEWKLDEHAGRAHYPIASWVGDVLYPDSVTSLENIVYAVAFFKIALAMVWLMVVARNLTMGIAWHRFTAWFNIWFKRESSGRPALGRVKPLTSGGKPITLDDIDDLDEDSTLGAGSIEDFSWKGVLDFTTCTECGRCQSQCPAWNTEKPLSPKLLVMGLREHAYAKAAGDPSHQERALVGKTETDGHVADADDWFYNPEGGDFVIDADVLWSCTSCGACVQQCPVDIEHVDHIVDMRRYQVLVESSFPTELNGLFKGLENKGNPWNMSATARMDWAKGLDFEVKVVGETIESLDEVDWLFWVGCAGAYEDRAKKTTRAVAELLDRAGVSFGVLGNGETCTGDPARRAGNEFVFQGLAQQNVEVLTEAKAKKVVSTCPHCMNTLKNEYRELGIELEVIHHTQLLNRLVRDGRLTPMTDGAGTHQRRITYHDPCYLGRHNQVYSPPRELLQIMPGAEYAEMERNSERSFCCGAGGARMWMEETLGERINVNRTNEAVGTGADQIAVGCPFCRVMLSDGLTAAQAAGTAREEVEVLDVAQMLLASVKGEQATKLKPGDGAPAPAGTGRDRVETKAEPTAGDVTITPDTVVDTADAGPAAKASGGSSLFDDAGAAAAEDTAPAAEAAPSGGSLFDEGGGSSLFDTPAEKPVAERTRPDAEAAASGGSPFDVGGGSSLFDTPTPEQAASKQETAPPAEPAKSGGSLFDVAPEPAPKPAEEAMVDAEVEGGVEAVRPARQIPSGGSLFDVEAPTESVQTSTGGPPPPGTRPEETPVESDARSEEAAAAATRGGSAPAEEIPSGGSLFDIQAPTAPAPAAADADAAQADAAATGSVVVPDAEVADDSVEDSPAKATGAAAAATPPPSPAGPTPSADIPTGGSLFDIPAPEASAAAGPTPVQPAAEPDEEAGRPEESTASETESGVAESDDDASAGKTKSSETNQPRTDVDINKGGSLFDL